MSDEYAEPSWEPYTGPEPKITLWKRLRWKARELALPHLNRFHKVRLAMRSDTMVLRRASIDAQIIDTFIEIRPTLRAYESVITISNDSFKFGNRDIFFSNTTGFTTGGGTALNRRNLPD